MPDEPNPKVNQSSAITSLATIMQSWAEMCSRQAKKEPTLELEWYLKGRAEAHALDAERARAMAHPTATIKPVKADLFTQAYKAALALLTGFANQNGKED